MSIASRIQAIEQHLEDDYSVLELAGADLTNVDKNIVNLKPTWKERLLYFMNNGTDEVWNNWDKVTGEGTSLTLNNTMEGKMKLNLSGNTFQQSYTGKNLLKLKNTTDRGITTKVNDDGSITLNGTATETLAYLDTGENANFPIGTYTLSIQSALSFNLRVFFYNGGTQMATATITAGQTSTTLTTTQATTNYSVIIYGLTSGTTYNFTIKPMLESGSTATDYEKYTNGASPNPDYPQDVHVVSGDNEVEVVGKNLLNRTTCSENYGFAWTSGAIYSETGSLASDYIRINIGDSIRCSYYCQKMFYDKNKNYLGNLQADGTLAKNATNSNTVSNFIVPSIDEIYYLRFGFRASYSQGTNLLTANIMVNKGSSLLPYEAYKGQSYPVNLGAIELCKIGTYQDKFIRNSGKNLGKVSFDSKFYLTGSGDNRTVAERSQDLVGEIIQVKPNTTYSISGKFSDFGDSVLRVGLFDSMPVVGAVSTKHYNTTSDKLSFTTGANTNYILLYNTYNRNTTAPLLMVNEGNTYLDYEPYGNGDWYLEKKIQKYTMTGNETFNNSSTRTNTFRFTTGFSDKRTNSTASSIYMYCNRGRGVPDYYWNTDEPGVCEIRNATNRLVIFSLPISEVYNYATAKTWFENNETILYYQLDTPTYTKITGTLESQLNALSGAKSYNSQTNISQTNNDLASVLNASALQEM